MFNFLGNMQQGGDIRRLAKDDRETRRDLDRATEDAANLEKRLDRLTLACAAMWSMLKEQGHTEEQLLARMQELDLRDGTLDGKIADRAAVCPQCTRKSRADRPTCLYCGATLPPQAAFGIPT